MIVHNLNLPVGSIIELHSSEMVAMWVWQGKDINGQDVERRRFPK